MHKSLCQYKVWLVANSSNRLNMQLVSLPEMFWRWWMEAPGGHPETDCLGVFCSLITIKMASWHVWLVLPSTPTQELWQQYDFRGSGFSTSTASQSSSSLCGFLAWLGQPDREKIEEESRQVEVDWGGNPCVRKGLGKEAVSVQKGERKAELTASKCWGGQGFLVNATAAGFVVVKNLEPNWMSIPRRMAHRVGMQPCYCRKLSDY